jgi:hypothetical protein
METEEPIIGGEPASAGAIPGQTDAVLLRLKQALAATVPGLHPEAIEGEDLAAIEASFASLCEQRRPAPVAVPAGAPGRSSVRVLSPIEKIREGLSRLERAG